MMRITNVIIPFAANLITVAWITVLAITRIVAFWLERRARTFFVCQIGVEMGSLCTAIDH
jgi:hypothetical protein